MSLCVAVDNAGGVVTSTRPASGRAAWHVIRGKTLDIASLTCPSARLCVGLNGSGHLVTNTRPAGGRSHWRTSRSALFDAQTTLTCASASFCAGVNGPNVITSTDPADGASTWHAVPIDNSSVPCGDHGSSECPDWLTSISCPSKSLCVAGDSNGFVFTSTKPAAGVSAWRTTSALVHGAEDVYASTAVGCTNSTLCFATNDGGLLLSTDPANTPAGWRPIGSLDFANQQPSVANLACPSPRRCVGLTFRNVSASTTELLAVTSTDPLAGAASWQEVPLGRVSLSSPVAGPVCPNPHLCVAVDASGFVEYSSDPTGGRSAWTVKHIDRYALDGLACPTTSLCVATDEHGDVLIGERPVTRRPATRKRREHARRPNAG